MDTGSMLRLSIESHSAKLAPPNMEVRGCNVEGSQQLIFAVVHYPSLDTQRINQFRRRYDPQVDLIEPHITLMFPVPESIGEKKLVNHLESVLRGQQPFPIHLQGLQRSRDDYLFLMIQEGRTDIIGLHNEIYTGVLANRIKGELPYVPHLTLGVFAKNANEYPEALEAAKRLDLDYRCVLDKIHLLKINDERTQIVWNKEFSLA
jgi:2'-5' RNA ligase